jgi:two-component system, sensor histidine kinase and response regulator
MTLRPDQVRDQDREEMPRANVLLVDDKPENLLALEAMLEDLPLNVVRAGSGEEALRRLLKEDFAVVLLDVQMPGMDGFDTATLIRERKRSRHIPIIFVTAINRTESHVYRGYSVGAVDYMFKPLVPEVLRAKVMVFVELFVKNEEINRQSRHIEEMNESLERRLEEVNRLNRELEALNSELESFNYSVSHDLRAPLRSVNGFCQILIEDYSDNLDDQGQDYLRRMSRSCQRMGELIDDLLQLSRTSRVPIHRKDVDLTQLAQGIIADLQKAEPERDAEVLIQDGLVANGDEHLLRVLVKNLLDNAWKFTKYREQAVIEVGAFTQDDGQLVYYVRDNGAGFDMEYAGKLFGAFQRLHSEAEFEGTGIGLATVQRIINRHGGKVWAEGAVDQGATFYFTL